MYNQDKTEVGSAGEQPARDKHNKWAMITKCSPDIVLRDRKDLIVKGILKQEKSGCRSTNYEFNGFENTGFYNM